MTTLLSQPGASTATRRVGLRTVFRAEWRKLTTQLSTRILTLVCLLGPLAYAVVLKTQSGVPTDALLGIWVHSSGFSVMFVLLVFAGSWGFPVLAGVASGDSFASESRFGTWKTVLTRSCTRRQLFIGKVLAVVALSEALVALLALSCVVSSLLLVGRQPAIGVDGALLSPGRALLVVALSWLWDMLPLLAFVALAVLFSVATDSGIAGVLGPVLVGYAMQLLALVGDGQWAHLLLVGSAFDGWHAFAGEQVHAGPLLVSAAVSLGWTGASLGAAWWILRRREFAGSPGGSATDWPRLLRWVAGGIAALVLVAFACTVGPTGVTETRLEDSVTTTYNNLTSYQQRLLGRPVPPGAAVAGFTFCTRRGHDSRGPGDDWVCSLQMKTPLVNSPIPGQSQIPYDVDVESNGCYRAEGSPAFVGPRTMKTPGGREAVNPLFIFYGCFNTL